MKKIIALAAIMVAASIAPVATAQRGPGAGPSHVTCDPYITAMYMNNQTVVSCHVAGGQNRTFYVNETDSPTAAEVLSFVHSYALTVKTIQVMPSSGATPPIQSFNQRVVLYLSNGRITGMRLITVG